jgi:hypothetical protein
MTTPSFKQVLFKNGSFYQIKCAFYSTQTGIGGIKCAFGGIKSTFYSTQTGIGGIKCAFGGIKITIIEKFGSSH